MLTHPSSAKVREGMTAHFSCLADGNPAPRYFWTKGDSNEVKYQIVLSLSLEVFLLQAISFSPNLSLVASVQTVGNYKCQAMVEGFPAVVSTYAKMSLVTKPTIISDNVVDDTNVHNDDNILFRISLANLERGSG